MSEDRLGRSGAHFDCFSGPCGFFLGMVLLAVALWRARVAPAWVAAMVAAAPVTEFVGPRALSPELMFALLTIAFGHIAVRLARSATTAPTTP